MVGVPAGRPVVVGVDGTPASRRALTWAVQEARAQRRSLRLLHAWDISAAASGYVPPDVEGARAAAGAVLDEATGQVADLARGLAPGLAVTPALVQGPTARVLTEESAHAALVVLGSHAHGALAGLLLGSTSVEVAAHADCPVVVVPGAGHDRGHRGEDAAEVRWAGPVLVGVDGSQLSAPALEVAFEAASRRREGLTVLYAWSVPSPYLPEAVVVLADEAATSRQARLTVAESLAGWRERFPDVAVTEVVLHGHPVDALVAASADAALLVVGSHGRGGFRGMLLGSVSQAVMRHAVCPVAVVRRIG